MLTLCLMLSERTTASSTPTLHSGVFHKSSVPSALNGPMAPSLKKKSPSYSPFTVSLEAPFSGAWVPENCTNGIDDDGDGFIDNADPDCGCSQTIMLAARDNGQILRVNLSTGGTVSVAASSPYVTGNLNALGANADNNLVYYCRDKTLYYWEPSTSTHGIVVDLTGKIGANESLSSGGGEYYNGYFYLGTENGNPGNSPKIWRQQLSANGKSFVGNPVDLNVPIPNYLSWGDIIATSEGGQTVLYCMAASTYSHFFKFNTATNAYTTIRSDLPTEMQLGVDIDGNTWAGSLSSGYIQKINRSTGFFYGGIINFGGNIWDLTGPINCPQAVEVCGNNIDDDGDGLVDNQDQDCLCPTITPNDATTRTICEGQSVSFNVSTNAPNPPYSYIEYYRFSAPQSNPYLSTDAKVWLGEFANTNGSGSVLSSDFPNSSSSNQIYYVYGCVKPEPQFPATCAPKVEYVITVKPAASLSASGDVSICGGTSTGLSASASTAPGPFTCAWSNGLGTGSSKTVTPAATTTYTVTATAGNGCTTTEDVVVTVNPTPVAEAGSNRSICSGNSTLLSASASGGLGPFSYTWSNGLGAGAIKTVAPTSTTTFTVTVTGSNGCANTDLVVVTVGSCVENCTNGIDDDGDGLIDCYDSTCGITVDAENYFCICKGDQADLSISATGGSGVYSYAWDNGLGTGPFKTVSPLVTTDYTVTVTATSGCTGTRMIHVVIIDCPEDCANGFDDDYDGLADCADPDCALVAAPALVNDLYSACPGTTITERVTYNDGNLQNPAYSISLLPTYGNVAIDGTGRFTYTPISLSCGTDVFMYQVCNQETGCCSQATVTLDFNDTVPPTLANVPDDQTIGCDEVVPDPTQVLAFDACPGIYIDFEETTDEYSIGGCASYTITRTWTATDLCGNETTDHQTITVQDLVAPEIFRVYTLPNGNKLVSGIAKRTAGNWKYVSFPLTFSAVPVVFSQCVSATELSAVTVQQRNVTTQGFEMRLVEQEGSTGGHEVESVSWVAIEPGISDSLGYDLEAGVSANISSTPTSIGFNLAFLEVPALLSAPQTTTYDDPFTVRYQSLGTSAAQVFLDEETAKDAETSHGNEKLGYLAVSPNALLNDSQGEAFGETGSVNLTNAWATVTLRKHYTKPIVILGTAPMNDGDPVTTRVMEVEANSFKVRLQEWDYQDGTHGAEQVAYIVVEGSIPADLGYYCLGKVSNLTVGENLFMHDNCDNQASYSFLETEELLGDGVKTTRYWASVDDCGNLALAGREDTCSVVALRLKTLLHGAYLNNNASGLMRDDLRVKGYLPAVEPFSTLTGYQHKGKGGGEVIATGLLDTTGHNAIVDWVFVEIRDSAANGTVLATQSALLQRDGDVVSVNGNEILYFTSLVEGDYYVSIRHRNHLGIVSDDNVYLSSLAPPLVDFTDMGLSVKGWNEAGKLVDGHRMMWAGDFNGDRKVIYQGPNNDVFYLFSRVLSDPGNTSTLANYISKGYDRNDFNLDGNIIYQGPNNERASVLAQSVLSHPGNSSLLANFIVRELLP